MIIKVKNIDRIRLIMAALGFMLLAPLTALGQDQEVITGAEAVSRLHGILSLTNSMQADVEQLILDQDGRELQESKARLVLSRPNNFYWSQTEPYEELMVTDGKLIWRYEPDLEQVTIQAFSDDPNNSPLLLLNSDAESLAQSFTINMTQLPFNGRTRFVLLPLDPGSLFERLSLTFYENSLEEMQFEDSLGQHSSLFFSAVERNIETGQNQFEFVMPAGVEVIDTTVD